MPIALDTRLSEPFCSYCGHPPNERWRSQAHRVCMRCELGMVLRAPPNAQPRFDEPFVIVDQSIVVQAVSHQAEIVLMVEEPAGVGVPLERFLVSASGDIDGRQLGLAIEQAVAGTAEPRTLQLQTVGDHAIRLAARVVSCGPPSAALVILSPPADVRRSTKRRGGVAPHGGGDSRLEQGSAQD